MMDPYQTLGISRSASDDEVKKAYRNLSRKYHPDANVNNPNKAQAEEKFKEVQVAYDRIMKERQQGYSSDSTYGEGPFGGFGGYYYDGNRSRSTEDVNPKLQAAANYIRNNYFNEAVHVLEDIPFSERNATWYYFSSVAMNGLGNNSAALEQIQRAIVLDPNNMQYRQFKQYLEYGGTWYMNMGQGYDRPYTSGSGFCMRAWLASLFCTLCCRPC